MPKRHPCTCIVVLWLVFYQPICQAKEPVEDEGFSTIFDGETLKGWSGNPRIWTTSDGSILGQSNDQDPLKYNEFLIWEKDVDDFVLRLQFRIANQGAGNSGVQYRSRPVPEVGKWVVAGYQADIDRTNKYMGILYEERGRGILAEVGEQVIVSAADDADGFERRVVGSVGEAGAILHNVRAGEWVDYEVSAIGNHLIHKVNGRVTVDVIDADARHASSRGLLALQIHVGPAMQIEFRRIRIRHELAAK